MGKTDALSRWSDHGTGPEDNDNMVLLTLNFFTVQALEGLKAAGEERGILKDIWKGMQDGVKEEPVVLAGRSGRWKTLELVSRNYWWPQMSRYVGRYVST